jgi:hypothetical protein
MNIVISKNCRSVPYVLAEPPNTGLRPPPLGRAVTTLFYIRAQGISCNVSRLTYFYVVRKLAINQYTYCGLGMLKFEAY